MAMNSAKSGCSASISKMFPAASPNRLDKRTGFAEAATSSMSALSLPMTGAKSLGASDWVRAGRSIYKGGCSATIFGGSAATTTCGRRSSPYARHADLRPAKRRAGIVVRPYRAPRDKDRLPMQCDIDLWRVKRKTGFFGTFTSSSRETYLSALTVK